jgi:hypothetical protein
VQEVVIGSDGLPVIEEMLIGVSDSGVIFLGHAS